MSRLLPYLLMSTSHTNPIIIYNGDVDWSADALFPILKILARQWTSTFVCACVGSLSSYINHPCFLLYSSHWDVSFYFILQCITFGHDPTTGKADSWHDCPVESDIYISVSFLNASIQSWYIRISSVSTVTEWTGRQRLMGVEKLFLLMPTQPPIQ
jgi:hypothetical protein